MSYAVLVLLGVRDSGAASRRLFSPNRSGMLHSWCRRCLPGRRLVKETFPWRIADASLQLMSNCLYDGSYVDDGPDGLGAAASEACS